MPAPAHPIMGSPAMAGPTLDHRLLERGAMARTPPMPALISVQHRTPPCPPPAPFRDPRSPDQQSPDPQMEVDHDESRQSQGSHEEYNVAGANQVSCRKRRKQDNLIPAGSPLNYQQVGHNYSYNNYFIIHFKSQYK